MTVETHAFQAEVKQVLHLVIHSLYSNKDIFLRELVSNASDACDKLRFEAIRQPELLGDDSTLAIDIRFDADARTVTIADNGIGMSRDELAEHLGTIARSGTKKFLENLSENDKSNAQLIGQFGVGFYSAFIVADRVSVTSRRAGSDEAWTWESSADGEFTLAGADRATRGTTIVLHLREGEDEYLNGWKLRSLVHKYSEHIDFPIRLPAEKAGEEGDGDESDELETVNEATALWTRARSEISDDEYKAFYKHVSGDFGDPLVWTHNRVEGNQNFTSLLYVPAKAPFDFMGGGRDERKGLKLYIKRVFIMDAAEQMLPPYLRFVRGVVDSDDLPLNVSRELLQSSRQVERIKGALTKRAIDLLEKLAREEPERYAGFWKEFGGVLKEGVADDPSSAERLMKLLRFPSTQSAGPDELVALEQYVERMKPGQDAIYYLTADGWNAARNSPQLEALKARGIEVLLMHERIDEWMAGYLTRFADKPFRNVAKGELDLDALEGADDAGTRAKREEAAKAAEPVVEKIKAALGERVKEVKVSSRLTDSASCLVLGEYDMALHMQRLLKAAGQMVPGTQPSLEINAQHPLVQRIGTADEATAQDLSLLLFEQAQIAEGAQLEDPAAYVQRVNRLLLG
ncbi:molecular chaperone HtpG [Coralloluteibacterium stylophorae]|uniref:Chaperone protein HtpG n=1 Tax=Coralloluteibacterium stylophorae TaxID=1776034 RepID=A0A8J8AXM2_9GAMM|nr:molecular chaperone HtpG [Coralloluteibacterium stylophorae]MBS7458869.1 molecular chaperone HtpG [Coralloluteibacterium stylophorae]